MDCIATRATLLTSPSPLFLRKPPERRILDDAPMPRRAQEPRALQQHPSSACRRCGDDLWAPRGRLAGVEGREERRVHGVRRRREDDTDRRGVRAHCSRVDRPRVQSATRAGHARRAVGIGTSRAVFHVSRSRVAPLPPDAGRRRAGRRRGRFGGWHTRAPNRAAAHTAHLRGRGAGSDRPARSIREAGVSEPRAVSDRRRRPADVIRLPEAKPRLDRVHAVSWIVVQFLRRLGPLSARRVLSHISSHGSGRERGAGVSRGEGGRSGRHKHARTDARSADP